MERGVSSKRVKVRCHLPPESWIDSMVRVSGNQAHHLIHVLRVKPGMTVTCFDGQGMEAAAVVEEVGRREVALRLKERRALPDRLWHLALGMAVPRHGKLDEVIDQATQLGASDLVPLLTHRGVVKLSVADGEKKQSRWKQIAIEAGKQSEVTRLPKIHPAVRWKDFIGSWAGAGYDLVLIAAVEGPHESLSGLVSDGAARSVLVLVGPEGDFTPEEIQQAVQAAAPPISLGANVLRCETAAVVAMALVIYLMDSR